MFVKKKRKMHMIWIAECVFRFTTAFSWGALNNYITLATVRQCSILCGREVTMSKVLSTLMLLPTAMYITMTVILSCRCILKFIIYYEQVNIFPKKLDLPQLSPLCITATELISNKMELGRFWREKGRKWHPNACKGKNVCSMITFWFVL